MLKSVADDQVPDVKERNEREQRVHETSKIVKECANELNLLIKVFDNFEKYDVNKQRAIKCAIGKLVANLCAVKDRHFVKWSFIKVLNKIKHTVEKDFEEQRKHL